METIYTIPINEAFEDAIEAAGGANAFALYAPFPRSLKRMSLT